MKYFFLILTLLFCTSISLWAKNPEKQEIKIDPDTVITSSGRGEGKNIKINPDTAKVKLELYDYDLLDDRDDDSDTLNIPANELYEHSWSSERLNPYNVSIDNIKDTVIDLSGFVFPTAGSQITSPFGPRYKRHRFHYGTDIALATGDTVVAVFDGTVRIVDYQHRGYGHYVVIRHPNGLESVYAHFSRVLVDINQEVKAGDPIGLGGSTGRSSGPHLHFELRFLGNAINTTKIINYATKNLYSSTYRVNKVETFSHKKEIDQLKAASYHKIKKGETLSLIAKRYGTTVAQLCKLNKIKPNTMLQIGRTIRYR